MEIHATIEAMFGRRMEDPLRLRDRYAKAVPPVAAGFPAAPWRLLPPAARAVTDTL
jgi:hypothetical protein